MRFLTMVARQARILGQQDFWPDIALAECQRNHNTDERFPSKLVALLNVMESPGCGQSSLRCREHRDIVGPLVDAANADVAVGWHKGIDRCLSHGEERPIMEKLEHRAGNSRKCW